MALFNGQLATNSVRSALYNMILGMDVLTDNFKGSDLYSKYAEEAGLYGDRKLYVCSQPQAIQTWAGHEAESANLLATAYNKDVKEEEVVITEKFMSMTTTDQYETKKAFINEFGFSTFTSLMKDFVQQAKRIHKALTYNAYVGTVEKTDQAVHTIEVDTDANNNVPAENIGTAIAELITAMSDYTTDYNSFGYLRRYAPEDIKVVFNNKYRTPIKYIDLNSIFHNENLTRIFEGLDNLEAKYFGTVNAGATEGDGSTVRSLIEQDITVTGGSTVKHYKPGDLIDDDYVAPAGTSYTVDDDVIAKVFVKMPVYLSGWEAATEFKNARGLTDNTYVIFTESKPTALDAYPVITIKAKSE